MDARVVQEAAGPGRFILGFGTSKIFLNNAMHADEQDARPDARRGRDRARRARRRGVRVRRARRGARRCPRCGPTAHAPREVPPVYVAATAPKMQALAGEIGDGCLTPSITTPAFVRYTRENVASGHRHRLHRRRLDPRVRPRRGPRRRARDRRHVPREQGAEHPGRGRHAARPRRDRAGRDPAGRRGDGAGGRLAAKAEVTDALLDKCKPIAGTPDDCIAAIEEYRDAGCTHVMLELWGDRRHEQIRLFGERVLPHFR